MVLNESIAELLGLLETIVGQYYMNEQDRGSFFFRYPVTFMRNGKEYQCKGYGRIPDLSAGEVFSVHYKTGANSLYIGKALFDVLRFLENRYEGQLDFVELERNYQRSHWKPSSFDILSDSSEFENMGFNELTGFDMDDSFSKLGFSSFFSDSMEEAYQELERELEELERKMKENNNEEDSD